MINHVRKVLRQKCQTRNTKLSTLRVKVWNEIPHYITDLPKKTFKKVLRKLQFDILEKEDHYIPIPAII